MKRIALLLACAATLAAAQTPSTTTRQPAKPATSAAKPAAKPAVTPKSSTAAKPAVGTAAKAAVPGGIKLPPGIPVYRKLVKTAFALKYQDISIGTGPVAEPLKLYHVKYTGWLAADGKKFDASDDHPNKEPIAFPQGRGRVIPGWDQGFEGMKIGGKRRLFIPYQLAYGAAGRPPVIPAKSDLIFDIELMDVTDMPPPGGPGGPGGRPMPMRPSAAPGTPGATPGAKPVTPAPTPSAPATQPPAAPSTPAPATPPPATPPPATSAPPAPSKPANPAQPPQ